MPNSFDLVADPGWNLPQLKFKALLRLGRFDDAIETLILDLGELDNHHALAKKKFDETYRMPGDTNKDLSR